MMATARMLPSGSGLAVQPLFHAPLQWLAGFFFSFRFAITYLAFQSNPRAGTITILSCSAILFAVSAIYTFDDDEFSVRTLAKNPSLRWLLAYVLLAGISLSWTAAESLSDAAGLWFGMLMETGIIFLLVWGQDTRDRVEALFKGYVSGMLVVGAIAWIGPTLPDLRIGDYEFLHPNMIGMNSALAFLLAQYLSLRQRGWRWACFVLGITLLRSISKTSIIALCIAEGFYLIWERSITIKRKVQIAAGALVVFLMFASLLISYIEDYTTLGTGTQVETLTGRTAIWATAFFIAIEKPLIGHGFYSLRALMPAFDNGNFEPWHAHNELLQEFFEYGALGVIVTIGAYRSLFRAARRFNAHAAKMKMRPLSPLNKLVSAILLFTLIHGLTESMNFGLTIPLWLFAALAMSLEHRATEVRTQ